MTFLTSEFCEISWFDNQLLIMEGWDRSASIQKNRRRADIGITYAITRSKANTCHPHTTSAPTDHVLPFVNFYVGHSTAGVGRRGGQIGGSPSSQVCIGSVHDQYGGGGDGIVC